MKLLLRNKLIRKVRLFVAAAGGLAPGCIEMPVGCIERKGEKAALPPLKTGSPAVDLDSRRAVTGKNVDHLLVNMMRRGTRSARRDLKKKRSQEIVAAPQVADRAVQAETRPRLRPDREHVDSEVFVDWN